MAGTRRQNAAQKVECIAPELETEEESDGALMERAGRTLRQGIPAAATALLLGAEKGGITHIKLMLDLVGIEKGAFAIKEDKPRQKTLEEIFREKWEREP